MEYEFMTIDTPLPPSMPLPRAMLRLPISSTAKIMYARMLDNVLANGIEDVNGTLFICFPIVELSAALCRSTMTVKRSLNELEAAGLIVRVRQGFGGRIRYMYSFPERRAAVMNDKLEKLNQEIEKTEAKLRMAQHEEKILEHQIKTLTRKERTHRLCTRGAELEHYLPHPELLTEEHVKLFLKLLFHRDSTRQLIEQIFAGTGTEKEDTE